MAQTFDMTFCASSSFCKAQCDRRLLPETAAVVPNYRGLSFADFRMEGCGFIPAGDIAEQKEQQK